MPSHLQLWCFSMAGQNHKCNITAMTNTFRGFGKKPLGKNVFFVQRNLLYAEGGRPPLISRCEGPMTERGHLLYDLRLSCQAYLAG